MARKVQVKEMEYHPGEKGAMSKQKYEKAIAVRKRWRRGEGNHLNPLNPIRWRSVSRQMYTYSTSYTCYTQGKDKEVQ